MSILWQGGEEIDFPMFGTVLVMASAIYARSGYARCSLYNNAAPSTAAKSAVFSGGAITSGWLACRAHPIALSYTAKKLVGFGKSGTEKGLCVGISSTAANRIALIKYDGTTGTQLAAETGNSFANGVMHHLAIQLTSYGASANVKVYLADVSADPLIDYTGDVTVSGVTDVDSVFLFGNSGGNNTVHLSEIIVATEDPRTYSLVTLAPSAAGDSNAWTGAYTDVDEIEVNDADLLYSATTDQDFLCNVNNLPAGTFIIKAVKVAARAAKGQSGITGVKLGVKSGGTIDVDSTHTLVTAWDTEERLMLTNPVTASAFTQSEIDALQLALRSAT